MRIQTINFTGKIASGDIIRKLKDAEKKANNFVVMMEDKAMNSANKINQIIYENPKNPTNMDLIKQSGQVTTSVGTIVGSMASTLI